MSFAARIGRVRMKNGGADLTVIEGWQEPDDETCEAHILDVARTLSDRLDMNAYFLITLHDDGEVTFSHRVDGECQMPRSLMPTYFAELVRRYVVAKPDAQKVFETMFGWAE